MPWYNELMAFEDAYLPKAVPDADGLLRLGFSHEGETYYKETVILDGAFLLQITVTGISVTTKLIETESGEPYELYRVESAHGDYVGMVRDAVKEVLMEMRATCYPASWTQRSQPKEILNFIHRTFGEEEEYPWDDVNAVVRRKDNRKWYALFMPLPVSKLGIDEDRHEVIMNIAHNGADVDHRVFYPAYHMNKKSWVSMVLDGSVPSKDIEAYITQSRESAGKSKKRK